MFDTERFILEVQQRDVIWNVESPLYYNRDAKRDAWIDIFNTMFGKRGKTFEDLSSAEQVKKIDNLQKKWKNIRDHFKKNRRWVQAPGTHPSKVIKPYLYSELLEFLIPILENSRSRSENSIEIEEPSLEDLNDQVITDEETNADTLAMLPVCEVRQRTVSDESQEPSKRLKRTFENDRQEVPEEKPPLRRLDVAKEEEDADKLFLLSLLPQIRPLDIDQKNFLYIEILQSIQKAKYYKHPMAMWTENQEAI